MNQHIIGMLRTEKKQYFLSVEGIKIDYYVDASPSGEKLAGGQRWQAEISGNGVINNRERTFVKLIRKLSDTAEGFLSEVPGHWYDSDVLKAIQIFLRHKVNINLMGPTGAGKTEGIIRLSNALGYPMHDQHCGTIQRPLDWFGSDAARDGSTHFEKSLLWQFIEKARQNISVPHIILWDEFTRVHAQLKNSIIGFFDDRRRTSISTVGGSFEINLPPNVVHIATSNIGKEYTGTFREDAAIFGRCIPIRVGYMPEGLEIQWLIRDVTGLKESDARQIVLVARDLREKALNLQLTRAPSYRECLAVAKLCCAGMPLKKSVEIGMIHGYLGMFNDPTSEAGVAWQCVEMKLST